MFVQYIALSELSEFEAAALEEAKKLDGRAMPATVVESNMTDTSTKDHKISKDHKTRI